MRPLKAHHRADSTRRQSPLAVRAKDGRRRSANHATHAQALDANSILNLQKAAGNVAVNHLMLGRGNALAVQREGEEGKGPEGAKGGVGLGVPVKVTGKKAMPDAEVAGMKAATEEWPFELKEAEVGWEGSVTFASEGGSTVDVGPQFGKPEDTGLVVDASLWEHKFAETGFQAPGVTEGPPSIGLKGGFQFTGGKTGLEASLELKWGSLVGEVTPTLIGLKYDEETIKAHGHAVAEFMTLEVAAGRECGFELPMGSGATAKFSGSIKPALTFEPNWTRITAMLAEDLIPAAIDVAASVAPIAIPAALVVGGILDADSWGQFLGMVNGEALDRRRSAVIFFLAMTGVSTPGPIGPRSEAALAKANEALANLAAQHKLTVEEYRASLKASSDPAFVKSVLASAESAMQKRG